MRKLIALLGLPLVLVLSGCPLSTTPAGATLGQKFSADAAALKQVVADIKAKCPALAPFAPLLADALAVASDPYNLLADVSAAMQAIPMLKQDYGAIKCALQTLLDDYKALKPQPGTKAAQKIEILEQAIVILDTEPGALELQCASPVR